MPRDTHLGECGTGRDAAPVATPGPDGLSAPHRPGAQDEPAGVRGTLAEPSGPFDPFSTVMRTRLSDQAYGRLFHKIVTGAFKEGDMLPSENDLCRSFQVSRPIVREALRRLRQDGLVASRRGSGSFVQPRPPVNVSSAFVAEKRQILFENLELRKVIEPQAAAFAAARRTERDLKALHAAVDEYERLAINDGTVSDHLDFAFHLAVAVAAHNSRFVDVVRLVEYDIDHAVNLVRYLIRFDHLERSRSVHAEHARILDAIERRDPEAAAVAMRDHLEQARVRMVSSRPQVLSRSASPTGARGREPRPEADPARPQRARA
jgi:GntR family transcriptional regulator, transcriptional repressor for pyruvate dehydrogenase complex